MISERPPFYGRTARQDYPLTAHLADAYPNNRQREAVRVLQELDELRSEILRLTNPMLKER